MRMKRCAFSPRPLARAPTTLHMTADDLSRRDAFSTTLKGAAALSGLAATGTAPTHALGELPEVAQLSRLPAHAVVKTQDMAALVDFLTKGVGLRVLRTEKAADGAEVNFVGFGPEQLVIPSEFQPGLSTFADYGGHFSFKLVSVPEDEPLDVGFGLAYFKLGMPFYRFSKVLEYGGEVISSYGWTYVRAPGGLPLQIVLGDQPRDPIMLAAVYVKDIKKAEAYYAKLGMKRQDFPYARATVPSVFEPQQPKNSVFMGFSDDSFGMLLLPCPREIKSLNVGNVYQGLEIETNDLALAAGDLGATLPADDTAFRRVAGRDVDGYGLSFISAEDEQRALKAAPQLSPPTITYG